MARGIMLLPIITILVKCKMRLTWHIKPKNAQIPINLLMILKTLLAPPTWGFFCHISIPEDANTGGGGFFFFFYYVGRPRKLPKDHNIRNKRNFPYFWCVARWTLNKAFHLLEESGGDVGLGFGLKNRLC